MTARAIDPVNYPHFVETLTPDDCYAFDNVQTRQMMHAALGVSTEAGEILDVFKKYYAYGKAVDLVNLDEEFGDLLWYIQLYANQRGRTLEYFIDMNMKKLSQRYKGAFSAQEAINRDLEKEREVLDAASLAGRDE